jgi:hypothetical protein
LILAFAGALLAAAEPLTPIVKEAAKRTAARRELTLVKVDWLHLPLDWLDLVVEDVETGAAAVDRVDDAPRLNYLMSRKIRTQQ